MENNIERSTEHKVLQLMLALDHMAEKFAESVGGNKDRLMDDSIQAANQLAEKIPAKFAEKLLTRQGLKMEAAIDVNVNH